MNFSAFFQQIAFNFLGNDITYQQITLVFVGLLVLGILGYFLIAKWLKKYFLQEQTEPVQQKRISLITLICLSLIGLLLLVFGFGIDFPLQENQEGIWSHLRLSTILQALLIYYGARLLDKMLSDVLTRRYHQRREQQIAEGSLQYEGRGGLTKVSRIIQPIIYLLAISFILQELGLDKSVHPPWVKGDEGFLTINTFISAILILLFTRLMIWIVTEIFLYPYYKKGGLNLGTQYAINRLLTYFFFIVAIFSVLPYIGIKLTLLWGGAAALLVGVGLGLQQTFNDLISGVILLFERTIEVGDVVEANNLVGTVKKIGIRTSLVETRDNISVIVPNSKMVGENVVNWTHFDAKVRFIVNVGVAYGSDTALVKKILLEAGAVHSQVLKKPKPFVRFTNFGDSSLDFEVHFWSRDFIKIEDIKSDLRFYIDQKFREANVSIPFPQRDIWIRKE